MAARREGAAVKRLNRGPSILASYAELARISNLPTCISNVLVGCAIGAAASTSAVDWGTIVGICVAISLF